MRLTVYLQSEPTFRHIPKRVFEIVIPDDVVKKYAREDLDLFDREEAYRLVEENPPEKH